MPSRRSFEEWATEAGPRLMRFAVVVAGREDAADLVQDALERILTRWSRFEDSGSADSYARRVIANQRVSNWRRWGRRAVLTDPIHLVERADEAGTDSQPGVAPQVIAARELMVELSASQRAAVYLRFHDDMSYRQIATVLRCSEATARSHIHRALQLLRARLTEGHIDD